MKQEGMVHALEEIHRLLTPGGELLDIHPVPTETAVQVVLNGAVLFAEASPDHDHLEEEQAEDALAQVVRRGLFVIERSEEFTFHVYGSSVVELVDFMAEANAFDAGNSNDEAVTTQKEELYARVEEVVHAAGEEAEVVYLERGRIARLKPLRS